MPTEFEASLFSQGRFEKTDGIIIKETVGRFDSQQVSGRDLGRSALEERRSYEYRHALWLRHYRGVIPAGWEDPHAVAADIRRATAMGVNFDNDLTEAILAMPHSFALELLSRRQGLSVSQLAIVIGRADLQNSVKDAVSVNQRILGRDHNLWREAGKEVKKAKEEGRIVVPHLKEENASFISSELPTNPS